jgi:pimeloyl-ACP methyl ester carboxylesterase
MRALLVHGMGRTPVSMMTLAHGLRRAGITPSQFGYSAAFESIERILGRLRQRLGAEADGEYVAVGHSLGGLLLRAAIADLAPGLPRPRRLVMIGTPNQSPRLARRFLGAFWFRAINGDAGRLLASPERMATIPTPALAYTIIAGTSGPRGSWSPFGDEVNDGLISVDEARLGGNEEFIELPILHPFMPYDRRVSRLVMERCATSS